MCVRSHDASVVAAASDTTPTCVCAHLFSCNCSGCRAVWCYGQRQGNLRRMVYLFLKEVADATNPAEIIIVVQSLCQDMNKSDAKSELYRANACRVLSRILDVRHAWPIAWPVARDLRTDAC